MSDSSQGPGWWVASDGKWYAPELHPDALASTEAGTDTAAATDTATDAQQTATDVEPPAAAKGAEAEGPGDQGADIAEGSESEATAELSAVADDTAVQDVVEGQAGDKAPVYLTAATATSTRTQEPQAAWTPTTYGAEPAADEAAESDEEMVITATTNIVAGLIALVGAALIVVGSFLPWGEATGFLSGTVDGFDSNGVGTLIAGVVLAGSAGLLLGGVRHVLMLVAVLGSSLVAIGLAVYSMFDITGSASDKLVDEVISVTGRDAAAVAAAGTGLDISYGLWMVLAGGAIGLISAVFVRFNE